MASASEFKGQSANAIDGAVYYYYYIYTANCYKLNQDMVIIIQATHILGSFP